MWQRKLDLILLYIVQLKLILFIILGLFLLFISFIVEWDVKFNRKVISLGLLGENRRKRLNRRKVLIRH